jgi:hypothetical protein
MMKMSFQSRWCFIPTVDDSREWMKVFENDLTLNSTEEDVDKIYESFKNAS